MSAGTKGAHQTPCSELRTLYCDVSKDRLSSGPCWLTLGKDGAPRPAECRRELGRTPEGGEEALFTCDIGCEGADRDSVVSKYPNSNRNCIRFFTYNTRQEFTPGGKSRWVIWRSGACAMDRISLEVHCGYPN